jgi:glycerophosphoryl diester phosphodiesterase
MKRPALDWIGKTPIAHRGLHDPLVRRIENTRTAFEAAISHGFAIELDVQRSADGEAVVFHDDTLDRLMTRGGHVGALPAQQLFASTFKTSADRIESLGNILALVAGRVPLVIEIKSLFRGDLRLVDRVIEVMNSYSGAFVLKSFDPGMVIALRKNAPALPRGIVSMRDYGDDPETAHLSAAEMRSLTDMLHFAETEPDIVSWNVEDLPCAAPFFARTMLGRPLMTWTVRTAAQVARARQCADQMVFEGFVPEQ